MSQQPPTQPAGPADPKQMVGVTEFARRTGMARKTIRYQLEHGRWPGVQVGQKRAWRIPRYVLLAVLDGKDPAQIKPGPATPG